MRKVLGKICGWFSLFCASWLLAFNATAGVHFDLNVNVGAPGYFGPIPMVSGMVPQLWNVQPVIAVGPVVVAAEPIYLRVPNFQRCLRTSCFLCEELVVRAGVRSSLSSKTR